MASRGAVAAGEDLARLLRYEDAIRLFARLHRFDPSLIAAIISRETRARTRWCEPPPDGELGDGGRGHGPMQVDVGTDPEWCDHWRRGLYSARDGIQRGTEILAQKRRSLRVLAERRKVRLDLPRATVAAFNAGEGNVLKAATRGHDVDEYTTGGDYSVDVLERAEFLRTKGWV